MSINRVNISGHLTRDPELRMTPKGTQVLSFGIAVNDRRLNRETNQWEDYPNFVECTMFGTRAEAVGRIVRKGMKVSIDGKLRFNQWETKDGQKSWFRRYGNPSSSSPCFLFLTFNLGVSEVR